jgi:hypothetical protein
MNKTQPTPIKLSPKELESIREEIAHDTETDRKNYRQWFEEDKNHRKADLNPTFHKSIIDYLYDNGEVPSHMDCWDAPLRVLKEYGITDIVLSEQGRNESAKKEFRTSFYERFEDFADNFGEVIHGLAKYQGVTTNHIEKRYSLFCEKFSFGQRTKNPPILMSTWGDFLKYESVNQDIYKLNSMFKEDLYS